MTSSPSKMVIVLYIDYIVKGLNPGSYSTYLRIVYSRLNEPLRRTDTPIHFSRRRAFATEWPEHTLLKFLISQTVLQFVRNHVEKSDELV